jgi:hypothetical protein
LMAFCMVLAAVACDMAIPTRRSSMAIPALASARRTAREPKRRRGTETGTEPNGEFALDMYRHLVSPYKGYACAHRIRFDGESCSGFARRPVVADGWSAGRKAVRIRLRECRTASLALQHFS